MVRGDYWTDLDEAAEAVATPFLSECDNFSTGLCHFHFIFNDFLSLSNVCYLTF
jgi:hypothetical protein